MARDDILIRFGAELSGLKRDMKQAETVVDRGAAGMRAALGTLGIGVSVAGLAQFSRQIAEAGDQVALLRTQMQRMSGSASGLGVVADLANRLGIEFDSAAQAINYFNPAFEKMGRTFGDTVRFVEDFNKSLRVYGVRAQQAESITLQLSQAFSSGQLAGDELKSISENAAGLYAELERVVQRILDSEDSLKALGSQGRVTTEVLQRAFAEVFDQLRDDFDDLPDMLAQQEARMRNAWVAILTALDSATTSSSWWGRLTSGLSDALEGVASRFLQSSPQTYSDNADVLSQQQLIQDITRAARMMEFAREQIQQAVLPSDVEDWTRELAEQAALRAAAEQELLERIRVLQNRGNAATPAGPGEDAAARRARALTTGSGRPGINKKYESREINIRAGLSRAGENVTRIVTEAAKQAGIPPDLLYAIWGNESNFGTNTRLTNRETGAFGPFQFLPETGARYGVTADSSFDKQAAASARYLADILRTELVQGDTMRALMAYHGGENHDRLWGPKTRGYAVSSMNAIEEFRGTQWAVDAEEDAKRYFKTLSDGQKVFEATRTAAEKHAVEMNRLTDLYNDGAIGMETYRRAAIQSAESLQPVAQEVNEELTATQSLAMQLGVTFTSAFEDAIVKGGDLGDVLDGLGQDILRLVARMAVINPILNAIGGAFGGDNFQPAPAFDFSKLFTMHANGGTIMAGVAPGTYNAPVFFPMQNPRAFATGGIGVLGEAGPEAVVPLPDGKSIPVDMHGAAAHVEINVIEAPGQGGGQRERQGQGGQRIIDVFVERVRADMAQDVASGGTLSRALEQQYGLNRAAGGY